MVVDYVVQEKQSGGSGRDEGVFGEDDFRKKRKGNVSVDYLQVDFFCLSQYVW